MTTPHKHAALIHAWADGAIIQYQSIDNGWITSATPNWDERLEYRIQPAPTLTINLGGLKLAAPFQTPPEIGTAYWVPGFRNPSDPDRNIWNNDRYDRICIASGQCFASREQAVIVANTVMGLLKQVSKE